MWLWYDSCICAGSFIHACYTSMVLLWSNKYASVVEENLIFHWDLNEPILLSIGYCTVFSKRATGDILMALFCIKPRIMAVILCCWQHSSAGSYLWDLPFPASMTQGLECIHTREIFFNLNTYFKIHGSSPFHPLLIAIMIDLGSKTLKLLLL